MEPEVERERPQYSVKVPRGSVYSYSLQTKTPRKNTDIQKKIRTLQKDENFKIPRAPFKRVVKSVLDEHGDAIRMQREALNILQEGTEAYMIRLFQKSHMVTKNRDKIRMEPKDMDLVVLINELSILEDLIHQ